MANSRKIEVVIVGDSTALTAALGKASAQVNTFAGRMDATGKKMTQLGGSFNRHLTLPILVAGGASIKFAADFQRSMELVHTQAGASQAEVEKMSKAVLALAPTVGTGPDELAKALFHIESVGLRGAKALDALHTAALGAKVGQADLEATTNALAAAQVVQIKGTQNVATTMATLNAIVGVGNMRMNDLATAMGSGILPVAKNFGLSLRDVGAALAVLTDAGVPAVDAATRLRMSFAMMGAPTGKAIAELKKIKLSATDLADAMRKPNGLVNAITLLHDHLQGLSKTQQAAVLTGAFGGGRSSATIITLVNNLDRLGKKYNDIGGGISKYGDAVRKTTETDQFKFDQSLAQLQSTGIKIGKDLLPVLVTLAKEVGGVAAAFDGLSSTQQKVVIDSALVVAALGPILTVGGNVAKVVGGISTAFGALTTSGAGAAGAARPLATGLEGVGTAAAGAEAGAVGVGLGLTGLGVAAAVAAPLLIVAGGLFYASATATDVMTASMNNAKAAAGELGDALTALKTGQLDVKQAAIGRTTANKHLADTERTLAQLTRDGKKGTKEYSAALAANKQAQIDAARGVVTYDAALHNNAINQAAVQAAMDASEKSITGIARAANIEAVAQNRYASASVVHAAAIKIFTKNTTDLAKSEADLAARFKKSDPVEAAKHRRLAELALAAIDLRNKTGEIPSTHAIDVYYKHNLHDLEKQAHDLSKAIDGIHDRTVAVTVKFFQTGQIPTPNLLNLPHTSTQTKPIFPATGGLVTGGTVGRDSVPAMLTPGELVLNKKQQLSLLHGGAGGITFARGAFDGAVFQGAPTRDAARAWANVLAPELARLSVRRA